MIATFTVVGSIVAFAFFGGEGPSGNPCSYIHVKNTSEIDILILGFRCRPTIFKVSKGSGVKEIANAIIDTPAVTIVVPHADWNFPLLKGLYGSDPEPNSRIHVLMNWRKSTCTWLPQFPVWLSTTRGDLDRMAGGTQS
jgi:hypothetical protein